MFLDRSKAGKQLAKKLMKYTKHGMLVVALPRGGVAVGSALANVLRVPLEVVIVRKLGAPHNPELGIGAISEDGAIYLDREMIDYFQISQRELDFLKERELLEIERRRKLYRNNEPLPLLTNKTVILVDDGIATGVTAQAAISAVKKQRPKKIIFVVPVCSKDAAPVIRSLVDAFVCLETPERLEAIGSYYKDFRQVTDEEVIIFMQRSKKKRGSELGEIAFGQKIIW